MNIFDAVESCFRKYATFSGRARRAEYWYWVLFTLILSIVTSVLDVVFLKIDPSNPNALSPINAITTLATLLPGLAVSIRRLHDIDRSGWWTLIAFTGIGMFVLLYWYCKQGTIWTNRFGENPIADDVRT